MDHSLIVTGCVFNRWTALLAAQASATVCAGGVPPKAVAIMDATAAPSGRPWRPAQLRPAIEERNGVCSVAFKTRCCEDDSSVTLYRRMSRCGDIGAS